MTGDLQNKLSGKGLRIAIVVSRFNERITLRLLRGAEYALSKHAVLQNDITVTWVPGSFEIPIVAKKMAVSKKYDSVICLGSIIRGETDHYDHISREAARGISDAGLSTGIPVIFGVLTTDTVEQAENRSGGEEGLHVNMQRVQSKCKSPMDTKNPNHGNIGYDSAVTAIHMSNLMRHIGNS